MNRSWSRRAEITDLAQRELSLLVAHTGKKGYRLLSDLIHEAYLVAEEEIEATEENIGQREETTTD